MSTVPQCRREAVTAAVVACRRVVLGVHPYCAGRTPVLCLPRGLVSVLTATPLTSKNMSFAYAWLRCLFASPPVPCRVQTSVYAGKTVAVDASTWLHKGTQARPALRASAVHQCFGRRTHARTHTHAHAHTHTPRARTPAESFGRSLCMPQHAPAPMVCSKPAANAHRCHTLSPRLWRAGAHGCALGLLKNDPTVRTRGSLLAGQALHPRSRAACPRAMGSRASVSKRCRRAPCAVRCAIERFSSAFSLTMPHLCEYPMAACRRIPMWRTA